MKHPNEHYYNWLAYRLFHEFLQEARAHLKGQVVDLGCGSSPYRAFVLKNAEHYTGVDWANSRHELQADILADLNQAISLPDAHADTIISFSTLEHLCSPQTMLNEAFRILKPGGTIILQTPWQWLVHEAPHDYFRYTPYALEYMLAQAGFRDINVRALSNFREMMVLKTCYALNRLERGPKSLRSLLRLPLALLCHTLQSIAWLMHRPRSGNQLESTGYAVIAHKPDSPA